MLIYDCHSCWSEKSRLANARSVTPAGKRFILLTLMLLVLGFSSCADGPRSQAPVVTTQPVTPTTPVFTSTAPTTAAEGELYSYSPSATDPGGGTVSFALTTGPGSATLTGATLQWTPTSAQARTANAFTVTATTTSGGSATQNFSVTPIGNINGTASTKYYARGGPRLAPFDLSGTTVKAYVPGADGSFTEIAGTGHADGTFSIPQVPSGNYWLALGNALFWTNATSPALLGAQPGRPDAAPVSTPFSLQFNMTSVAALQNKDRFDWYSADAPVSGQWTRYGVDGWSNYDSLGATSWSNTDSFNISKYLLDGSKGDTAYLNHLQESAVTGGKLLSIVDSFRQAPVAFTEVDGQPQPVGGAMTALLADQNLQLKVAGSQFSTFDFDLAFSSSFGPAATNAAVSAGVQNRSSLLTLFARPFNAPSPTEFSALLNHQGWPTLLAYTPDTPLTTDVDAGSVPYANPFAVSEFTPVLLYQYKVATATSLPAPPVSCPSANPICTTAYSGSLRRAPSGPPGLAGFFRDSDKTWMNTGGGLGVFVAPDSTATQPVAPVVGPVSSVLVNGQPFANGRIDAGGSPTISWTAPTTGSADVYVVSLGKIVTTRTVIQVGDVILGYNDDFSPACCTTLRTTGTSVTVPPGLMQNGEYWAVAVEADSFAGHDALSPTLPVGFSWVAPGAIVVPAQ